MWLRDFVNTGGYVSQFTDVSGNGRHAAQPTASLRPTYDATGFGGLPCATFIDEGDLLVSSANLYGLSAVSAFIAIYTTDSKYVVAVNSDNMAGFLWDSNNKLHGGFGSPVGWANGVSPYTRAAIVGKYSIIAATGGVPGAVWNGRWGIAGYPYGVGLQAKIAEVIIYPTTVSTDVRQKTEGYLAHRFGFQANLPADHPYKSAAP